LQIIYISFVISFIGKNWTHFKRNYVVELLLIIKFGSKFISLIINEPSSLSPIWNANMTWNMISYQMNLIHLIVNYTKIQSNIIIKTLYSNYGCKNNTIFDLFGIYAFLIPFLIKFGWNYLSCLCILLFVLQVSV
jgi:TRAP-type mannitol/chloroaromatic compound transport system permease small subunit